MKTIKYSIWVLLVIIPGYLWGSNVRLLSSPELVSWSATEATIELTVGWDNSWRHTFNHDAVYIFGKYRMAGEEQWRYLSFSATGHEILTADYGWERQAGGIFLYRSTVSSGHAEIKARLKWSLNGNTARPVSSSDLAAGKVDFSLTALEMVKIPLGMFHAGESGVSNSFSQPFFGSIPAKYDIIGTNSTFAYSASGGSNVALPANRANNSSALSQCWQGAAAPSWWRVDFKTAKTIRYFGVSSSFTGQGIPAGAWYLEGSSDATNWVELWVGDPDDFSTAYVSYPIQKALKVEKPGSWRYYRIRIPAVDAGRAPFGSDVLICNIAMTEEELGNHFTDAVPIDGYSEAFPAAYPSGYYGMYVMKYELSQEQYVDFLNKQSYSGQFAHTVGGELDRLKKGEYVFGTSLHAPSYRNGIVVHSEIAGNGQPGIFACDLNSLPLASTADDGQTVACNYVSIESMLAYADWAGLRPLTELEYEKICRVPYPAYAVEGEYSWNTASAVAASGILDAGLQTERFSNGNINAANSAKGPVRSGIFAKNSTIREQVGVSFWGVEDLSGNLACIYVNAEAAGRSFNGGVQGDGALDQWGRTNASENSWPRDPRAYGVRGGNFSSALPEAIVADRTRVKGDYFTSLQERKPEVGVRLGCNLPYSVAEIKLTLMNGRVSGTSTVYDTVCDGREYFIQGEERDPSSPVTYTWYRSTDLVSWDLLEGEVNSSLRLSRMTDLIGGNGKTTVYYRQYSHALGYRGASGIVALLIAAGHTVNKLSETLQPCMAAEGFTITSVLPATYQWRCWESGKNITPDAVSSTSSTYRLRTADFRKTTEQPNGHYTVEIEMLVAKKCVERRNVDVFVLPYTSNPYTPEIESVTYTGQTTQRLARTWGGHDAQQWTIANSAKGTLTLESATGVLGDIPNTMVVHVDVELVCVECPDRVWTRRLEEQGRTFNYTGTYAALSLLPANYRIECVGAQGTNGVNSGNGSTRGGYGASAVGDLALSGAAQRFFIYVGGQGSIFNANLRSGGPVGGGATDFRLTEGTWSTTASLLSRVIVAGGGGGGCNYPGAGGAVANANAGNTAAGGLTAPRSSWARDGKGAAQTSGGPAGSNYDSNYWGEAGSFGIGGVTNNNSYPGSGGGGYYGGGAGTGGGSQDGNGGGGSSFISGHPGCNAPYAGGGHSGSTVHYSGIRFTNTTMTANSRSGHGYARITVLP